MQEPHLHSSAHSDGPLYCARALGTTVADRRASCLPGGDAEQTVPTRIPGSRRSDHQSSAESSVTQPVSQPPQCCLAGPRPTIAARVCVREAATPPRALGGHALHRRALALRASRAALGVEPRLVRAQAPASGPCISNARGSPIHWAFTAARLRPGHPEDNSNVLVTEDPLCITDARCNRDHGPVRPMGMPALPMGLTTHGRGQTPLVTDQMLKTPGATGFGPSPESRSDLVGRIQRMGFATLKMVPTARSPRCEDKSRDARPDVRRVGHSAQFVRPQKGVSPRTSSRSPPTRRSCSTTSTPTSTSSRSCPRPPNRRQARAQAAQDRQESARHRAQAHGAGFLRRRAQEGRAAHQDRQEQAVHRARAREASRRARRLKRAIDDRRRSRPHPPTTPNTAQNRWKDRDRQTVEERSTSRASSWRSCTSRARWGSRPSRPTPSRTSRSRRPTSSDKAPTRLEARRSTRPPRARSRATRS